QAEDGIRDFHVTGVQTCALPISLPRTQDSPKHSKSQAPLRGNFYPLSGRSPPPGVSRGRKGGERVRDGEWVADTGTELRGILKVMVDVGWLPGGVAVVGSGEVWENVAVGRVGVECGEAVAAPDTRYDVAELTKV